MWVYYVLCALMLFIGVGTIYTVISNDLKRMEKEDRSVDK